MKQWLAILIFPLLFSPPLWPEAKGSFFLEGDGVVHLINSKSGAGGKIRYRLADGRYQSDEINRVFGAPNTPTETISLRLAALLDHLQDHFRAGPIRIVSGYRSPSYNEGLRKKGKLAARTSLHIEGMAADIEMGGVDGKQLWDYVRSLDCCGAGYYHGRGIHIDTGPSRFWDETSTGVEKDLGGHNKLILLRTDKDIYKAGEIVSLSLSRITDYPVGVRLQGKVMRGDKEILKFPILTEDVKLADRNACVSLKDRIQVKAPYWQIPADFHEEERLKIRLDFCDKPFPEMPDEALSNPIQID